MGREGVLFLSLSALSVAINISLSVFKACILCLGDKNSAFFHHLFSQLNTCLIHLFLACFIFRLSLEQLQRKKHLQITSFSNETNCLPSRIQMAWRGCKHLLCALKCIVTTNPPPGSSQKTYKSRASIF